ncbi:MAG: hypothetical protein ISS16_10685 [Ignavibacteria bacterium]|nr:hypothetical protein [Ignavibacteria bacterium]
MSNLTSLSLYRSKIFMVFSRAAGKLVKEDSVVSDVLHLTRQSKTDCFKKQIRNNCVK